MIMILTHLGVANVGPDNLFEWVLARLLFELLLVRFRKLGRHLGNLVGHGWNEAANSIFSLEKMRIDGVVSQDLVESR